MKFQDLYEKENKEHTAVSPGVQTLPVDQYMGTYKFSKDVAGHDGKKQHSPDTSDSKAYTDKAIVVGYTDLEDRMTKAVLPKTKQTVGAGSEEPSTVQKNSPLSKNSVKEAYQNDEANVFYKYDTADGKLKQRMVQNLDEPQARSAGYKETQEQALKAAGIMRSKFDPKKFVQNQNGKWVTVYPYGQQGVAEEKCPHCGGELVSEELMNEKQDACYRKVKSRYKVWPSAYASGALVQCRKKGAANWGNKSESAITQAIYQVDENLKDWFGKEKWVRFGPDGKIKGDCARGDDSEGKPKCLPQAKAHALGKKGRASAAARKRREDPNPERSGKAINVSTKKKSNESVAEGTGNKCPPATQDITLNLKNRQKAIDEYGYGPLNPALPNTKFWMKKVDEWNLDSADEAKQSLCGNCAAFDQRQDTLDCIAQGIDSNNPTDAESVIDAGDLGYCKFLKFKCAAKRTCDAWVTGGPLTDKEQGVAEGLLNFEEGDCPIFAIALHRLSKMPLMALVEYDEQMGSTVLIHAYVKLDDRWRLDASGETDVNWMLQKYPNNGNAEEIEISEKDLLELGYGKSKCPTLQQVLPYAKEVLQNIEEGQQGVAEGKDDKIAQLKKDHDTAVHWSKNETSPQKREAARRKAETIKAHLEKQYKQGVTEAKDLAKKVKVVKGEHAGKIGWIREIKHGAHTSAPKTYYIDLDDGGQANNLPATALRLVKAVEEGITADIRDYFANPKNDNASPFRKKAMPPEDIQLIMLNIKQRQPVSKADQHRLADWLRRNQGTRTVYADVNESDMGEGVIYQLDKENPMSGTEVLVIGGAGRYSLDGLRAKARKEVAELARDLEIEHGGAFRRSANNVKQLQNTLNTIVAAYDELNQIRKLGGLRSKGIKDEDATVVREGVAVMEKWTQKYKNSINCSDPKGFSQRAHCAGKKK